jgi:hypothetical protein
LIMLVLVQIREDVVVIQGHVNNGGPLSNWCRCIQEYPAQGAMQKVDGETARMQDNLQVEKRQRTWRRGRMISTSQSLCQTFRSGDDGSGLIAVDCGCVLVAWR